MRIPSPLEIKRKGRPNVIIPGIIEVERPSILSNSGGFEGPKRSIGWVQDTLPITLKSLALAPHLPEPERRILERH